MRNYIQCTSNCSGGLLIKRNSFQNTCKDKKTKNKSASPCRCMSVNLKPVLVNLNASIARSILHGFAYDAFASNVSYTLYRVLKCDVTKKQICEIMGFRTIFE